MTAAPTTPRAALTPLDRLAQALERAAEAAARVGWAQPAPTADTQAQPAASDALPSKDGPQ